MHKIRRQMSSLGKQAHFMELRIDETKSVLGKGLPLEAQSEEEIQDVPRSARETFMYIFRGSALYILLPVVPVGIIAGAMHLGPGVVFALNCLAIIPLASLLCFATEELASHVGETLGGLMNATFGNAVEIIVSYFALRRGEIRIVQASMLGSILSNLLLVLGCCFTWGGYWHGTQQFNDTVAGTMSSLMAVGSASLILPAVLYLTLQDSKTAALPTVLTVSRLSSIILLLLYVLFLVFQLYTHKDLFDETAAKKKKEEDGKKAKGDRVVELAEADEHHEEVWANPKQRKRLEDLGGKEKGTPIEDETDELEAVEEGRSVTPIQNGRPKQNGNSGSADETTPLMGRRDIEDEEAGNRKSMVLMVIKTRHLSVWQATLLLTITTVIVSICADYLVDAIDPFVESNDKLSKGFIGLIILPIVGNAAEHFTAIVASGKNKMDLAISVAVGSSLQIAIGVTPLLVLLGWVLNQPMSLYFQPFETVVLFVSVLIANYLVQDGESNYLEGMMLLGTYAIIGICFFVLPDETAKSTGLLSMLW